MKAENDNKEGDGTGTRRRERKRRKREEKGEEEESDEMVVAVVVVVAQLHSKHLIILGISFKEDILREPFPQEEQDACMYLLIRHDKYTDNLPRAGNRHKFQSQLCQEK